MNCPAILRGKLLQRRNKQRLLFGNCLRVPGEIAELALSKLDCRMPNDTGIVRSSARKQSGIERIYGADEKIGFARS